MPRVKAVVGSGFGDEGKGHITDVLANEPSSIVVRANGGAQASHTVVTPDGKRYAFRHFGSGTFTGSHTFLAKEFFVNPISFCLERQRLIDEFFLVPVVFVHPMCRVTTIWDVAINQAIEAMRGDAKHGSCGMGINETAARSKMEEYRLLVSDLLDEESLKEKLIKIRDEYVPKRLSYKYGINSIKELPQEFHDIFLNDENIDMYLSFAEEFCEFINPIRENVLERYENVIFEGAQGLLLDQSCREFWPHVTTSNTGIKNVQDTLKNFSFEGALEIYYVSRCYLTRHGNGPFPSETTGKPYPRIEDPTNVYNKDQGSLRYGILDVDRMLKAIKQDIENLEVKANIYITFTCMDQIDDFVRYIYNGEEQVVQISDFLRFMSYIFKENIDSYSGICATYGLTRDEFFSLKN